jgi:hypothetical protein
VGSWVSSHAKLEDAGYTILPLFSQLLKRLAVFLEPLLDGAAVILAFLLRREFSDSFLKASSFGHLTSPPLARGFFQYGLSPGCRLLLLGSGSG